MAIKLKDQPRHVLLGLARKNWQRIKGYFGEDLQKKGPKGLKAVSNVSLRQRLRDIGVGV